MIFEFALTVPANTLLSSPASQELKLSRGIVHKVEVLGDGGERNQVYLVIRRAINQVWPTNPNGQLHPGFFPISYLAFYALEVSPYSLTVDAWSPGTTYDHQVLIRLGIEPREVLEGTRPELGILKKLEQMIFGR